MASSIAWLDSTTEEQRVARELISLFTQPESREELGIGQVRDAFSDILFPGTSVIQTRARYFLFIPWCYSYGKASHLSGARLRDVGRKQERELIHTLHNSGLDDLVGMVGRRVGPSVKTLPLTIYWSGLRRFEILTHDNDLGTLGAVNSRDGATELGDRLISDWDPGLPPAPAGFPTAVPGGFRLTFDEAEWLAKRITGTSPESVTAHLLERRIPIGSEHQFAWEVVPEGRFEALEHARRFSGMMLGASLLYNLLIGEEYDKMPPPKKHDEMAERYRDEIDTWVREYVEPSLADLRAWDVARMWELTLAQNPRIDPRAQAFANAWIEGIRSVGHNGLADNRPLRQLVRAREERKGKQSRLLNERMLATWSGASGTGQLEYRWGTVRVIVNDIIHGLNDDAGT